MHQPRPINHTRLLIIRTRSIKSKYIALGTGTSQVLVLDLESRAGSLRGIVRVVVCGDGAGCYVVSEDGAGEDLVGGFGLVGWDFVAGLENTREGEIAILPHLTADIRVVGGDVGVSGVVEFFALAVWDV